MFDKLLCLTYSAPNAKKKNQRAKTGPNWRWSTCVVEVKKTKQEISKKSIKTSKVGESREKVNAGNDRNAEKCEAFRHRKTEMEKFQLYTVYIDYKKRRLLFFFVSQCFKYKHIQA